MESISTLFKILSDETRLRIIHLLYHHDLCVCELVEILDESQPKISKHIAKIRTEKLVSTNQNQQFIYYSLKKDNPMTMNVLNALFKESNDVLSKDLIRLNQKSSFVCTSR